MKEKWMVINKKQAFEKLNSEIKEHPLIVRLLANRGITTKEEASLFLNGKIEELYDGRDMKDMDIGISIIKDAIKNGEKIAIYGDYDCDGVCSTTIFYDTLKYLEANFIYYIPNREEEGYGMNSERIRKLYNEGVRVILTCDNGISAIEQVKVAKELGLKVVITDHHDIPYIEEEGRRTSIIPEADAVINPKREDCSYKFKELCGAGVALKFSKVLVEDLGKSFEDLRYLYEFAAIATICDVVELIGENRIIVKEGLRLINNTQNKGLRELIKVTELEGKKISEYHFGFIIGPCINATGRLETADLSVKLLTTKDEEEARKLAKTLYDLNVVRKDLTAESVERVLEKVKSEIKTGDKVILVYDEEIHESIAGIVAGRIRETFNLPTIVMTKGKDMPKGSGRSIEGYNMFEELNKCKDLIEKFGGHPMAAGLSVKEENIPALRKALLQKCTLTDDDVIPIIKIDSPLNIELINEELIEKINNLKPFGKGNNSPLFAVKNLRVNRVFFMGQEQRFLKIKFSYGTGNFINGVNFDKAEVFKEEFRNKYGEEAFQKMMAGEYTNFNMDIIFYPTINTFRDKSEIQLSIKSFRF